MIKAMPGFPLLIQTYVTITCSQASKCVLFMWEPYSPYSHVSLISPADNEHKREWKNELLTGGIFCVIGVVLFVTGVALWIAVGVVVANPPYESKWFSIADYNLYLDCLCIFWWS